jgi:hypothetical protein
MLFFGVVAVVNALALPSVVREMLQDAHTYITK